jgi:hypothetical protein
VGQKMSHPVESVKIGLYQLISSMPVVIRYHPAWDVGAIGDRNLTG